HNHYAHILPSYPTRRSSDLPLFERAPLRKLIDQWMELELALTRGSAPVRFGVTARCHPRAISDMTRFAGLLSGRLLDRDQGADPDRKSTRLNSSHVKISYAV